MSPRTPDLQPNLDFSTDQAERILEGWLGRRVACVGMQRLKGGLVNTVIRLDLDQSPYRAVVKMHDGVGEAFGAEARALEYLRSETTCPVPQVYLEDGTGRLIPYAFLLIEYGDTAPADERRRTGVDVTTSSRPTRLTTPFAPDTSSAAWSTGWIRRWSTWPCSATASSPTSRRARLPRSSDSWRLERPPVLAADRP
jgi:fructosamine-3-kinase